MIPGQEFDEFLQDARQDRAVATYLDSVSVSVGNWICERALVPRGHAEGTSQNDQNDPSSNFAGRIGF